MVRTRTQLKRLQDGHLGANSANAELQPCAKSVGVCDIPDLNVQKLKPAMIKTYSKKRPRRVTQGRQPRPNFLTPDSPELPTKTAETMDLDCLPLGSSSNSAQKILTGRRKHSAKSAKRSTRKRLLMAPRSSCKNNKTTVSIGSMVACTMMDVNDDNMYATQPMSMCSVVSGNVNKNTEPTTHNSTVDIANNCDIIGSTIVDYVPEDISIIKGDQDHKIISSFCNEQTPPVQKLLQTGISVKKVQFSVGRTNQLSKVGKTNEPSARRSILKTPRKSNMDCEAYVAQCPRTSSPDPQKKSTLLQSDVIPTNGSGVETDTEKLLEFELLPLECSDDNQSSYREITPETSIPPKPATCSSGTERRRLSYLPHGNDPVCILLDLPVSKHKNTTVLFGENQYWLSLGEMKALPNDILF